MDASGGGKFDTRLRALTANPIETPYAYSRHKTPISRPRPPSIRNHHRTTFPYDGRKASLARNDFERVGGGAFKKTNKAKIMTPRRISLRRILL